MRTLHPPAAVLLAIVAAEMLWLRHGLMVRSNALSNQARTGDHQARAKFDRADRLPVIVNSTRLIAVAWSLVRLARNPLPPYRPHAQKQTIAKLR